jgi:hypothetical protein
VPANNQNGETEDAEPVVPAIVAAETVIRNAIAVVSPALLPGAVLGLPAMGTITLPGDVLFAYLSWASLLSRPVVLLLTLSLALLILLPLGLFLLLLPLLILLPLGLLLLTLPVLLPLGLFLLLLPLLILLPLGLLLLTLPVLLPLGLFLLLLPLLILLPLSLLLLTLLLLLLFGGLSLLLLTLLLLGLSLLLPLGLSLLLLLLGLGFFFLFLRLFLPCLSRPGNAEKQKHSCCTDYSDWFHDAASITLDSCARHFLSMVRLLFPMIDSHLWLAHLSSAVHSAAFAIRRGVGRRNGTIQIR